MPISLLLNNTTPTWSSCPFLSCDMKRKSTRSRRAANSHRSTSSSTREAPAPPPCGHTWPCWRKNQQNRRGVKRRMRSLYLVSADCVQFLEHSFEICRFLPIAPHVNVKKPHFRHANVEKNSSSCKRGAGTRVLCLTAFKEMAFSPLFSHRTWCRH